MMKKIFLMTGLMCITLTIQAQKVKVKDGVVMLDGVPILGIVGRIGLSKMDIVYTSLQGDSLLSIKRKRHIVSSGFGATFDIRYGWCEMYFFNPKIHVKYKELTTYTTEKNISYFLFNQINPPLFNKEGRLDSAAVAEFVRKQDVTKKLEEDIAYNEGLYEAVVKHVGEHEIIKRNKNQPFDLRLIAKNYYTFDHIRYNMPESELVYEIVQDGQLIGKIYEQYFQVGGIAYKIERRWISPLEYKGEKLFFGLVACLTSFGLDTYDKKNHHESLANKNEIISYLIKNGYL